MIDENKNLIIQIAELIEYPRLNEINPKKLPQDIYSQLEFISKYTNDGFAIFFFSRNFIECGDKISVHFFGSIYSKNNLNYLTFNPEFNEKYLRKLFTGFEFLAFKLCKLHYHRDEYRYLFESEAISKRIKKIIKIFNVNSKMKKDMYSLIGTRDMFAHSFIDLEHIRFEDCELQYCFGSSYTGERIGDSENTESFVQRSNEIMDFLVGKFVEVQKLQIDSSRFFSALEKVAFTRKLMP